MLAYSILPAVNSLSPPILGSGQPCTGSLADWFGKGFLYEHGQSYTELATGFCYLKNGQYIDSAEEIDPSQGRYQVQWLGNANSPGGAVTVSAADGKQLLSTVYDLAY